MTRGRHSLAPHASKPRRFALLAAPLLTCGLVGAGVALAEHDSGTVSFASAALDDVSDAVEAREAAVSRSQDRLTVADADNADSAAALKKAPAPKVVRRLWTTADLDLRLTPTEDAKVAGEIEALTKVGYTGVRRGAYAQVLVKGQPRWVTAEYLAAKKPATPAELPLSGKPCPDGSVENGLTAGAVRVYRAVCNNFPQVTRYGGWDDHGEHSSGRAVDIMTSDVGLGNAIAEFLRAHAAELNLYDVIWRQRIFTQERAGEGWRSMSDRGSATANHYDHVHVSVY